ncbi:hypothetical protein [Desertivirga brevis]|uniref:hypothetical protein n=1 Tax=Desertivirga brevis TaxID=2810310 RepID=UPI001A967715|nr:hypothetical protein [Pedobacter sp. SYSU D00873]
MDYSLIIKKAWKEFNPFKIIQKIEDISAMVSTNHVFRVTFDDEDIVIAKLSYFGKYEHFKEDHRIIHTLANNLLYPFDNVLAKSLLKNNRVYTYRYKKAKTDAWVVFYNPVRVQERLPRRLDESQIRKLGEQMGRFHKACSSAKSVLPKSSKTLRTDVNILLKQLSRKTQRQFDEPQKEVLRSHCEKFLVNRLKCKADAFESIPVFIDWNIGNFSVTPNLKLFSRWDYDWFRISTRMMDFYFLSRVVSDVGDRTVFSYVVTTLMEDRFLIFLEEYHSVNPLTANEVRFMKEVYRFFILNYVIKDGKYFFSEQYAQKLQNEAFDIYLPSVDSDFDARKILDHLKLK